jgi:AcrR family transcriptional regulator/transposase
MKQAQQIPHRATPEVRLAIQRSGDSIRKLARRYGINPKTVAKWRRRESLADRKAGPRDPRSSALSLREEAIVVAFRQHLRLPLDGCLQALHGFMPQLSRSSLHRCLQRHGISRLPSAGTPAAAAPVEAIGFDIGVTEIGLRRRYQLVVAVERGSHFVHAELYENIEPQTAAAFLQSLIAAVPGRIASVVSDEGPSQPQQAFGGSGLFAQACAAAGIAHRTIKARQRWTGEQIERMNRTIAEAVGHRPLVMAQLKCQLADLLLAYNSRCTLSVLDGMTPLQAISSYQPRQSAPKPSVRTIESRDSKSPPRPAAKKAVVARKPRRTPDPTNTREAILQAARSCLAHDGPEGLSLAEVARMAGVNRGTAYQHFKTRDQLIAAAAVGVSEKLFQAVFGPAGATKDRKVGSVDVSALTDRLANFSMNNPELCRAWLLNVLSSPEPANDLFWREYQSSAERFDSTTLSQHNVDTEVLSVIALAGAFLWPVWARAQYGATQDPGALARRFAEESLRIAMYGNLRPERYPAIAKRLAERPSFRAGARQQNGGS